MRVLIEAGHGKSYRSLQHFDDGLVTEDGELEHDIALRFASTLADAASAKALKDPNRPLRPCKLPGHEGRMVPGGNPAGAKMLREGGIAKRLRDALKWKAAVVLSIHLTSDIDQENTGKVLWSTDGSRVLAETLALALGKKAEQVQAVGVLGMLEYTPAVEIQVANVLRAKDMDRFMGLEAVEDFSRLVIDTVYTVLEGK